MPEQWTIEQKLANRLLQYQLTAKADIDKWKEGEKLVDIMDDFRLMMEDYISAMFHYPEDFPNDDTVFSPHVFTRYLFNAGFMFLTDKIKLVDFDQNGLDVPPHGIKLEDGREIVATVGGLGGVTISGEPAYITVANPCFVNSENRFDLRRDGVLVKCGSNMHGFSETIDRWAYLYAQSIISIVLTSIEARSSTVIHAVDDDAADAADLFYEARWCGKQSAIKTSGSENPLQKEKETIHAYPGSASQTGILTAVLEVNQYTIAKCLNELGLLAQMSMKREAINSAEAGMNEPSLTPRITDILNQIHAAGDKLYDMYGVDWLKDIELADAWQRQQMKADAEAELVEAEADAADEEADAQQDEPEATEETEETEEKDPEEIEEKEDDEDDKAENT